MAGKPKRRKPGRPTLSIEGVKLVRGGEEIGSGYDLLKKLAGLGLTQTEIADVLCFSDRTLRNRLKDDELASEAYQAGRAEILFEIARRHRDIALGGSERESRIACEFWLERQFGWRLNPRASATEVHVGGALRVPFPPDTPEEWEKQAQDPQNRLRARVRADRNGSKATPPVAR